MDFTGEATRSPPQLDLPPEKRQKLYDPSDDLSVGEATLSRPLLEQPPEKFPKLYDSPGMKEQEEETNESKVSSPDPGPLCEICGGNFGHENEDCPHKSIGMGMCCEYCFGPCRQKEGDGDTRVHHIMLAVKMCVICGAMGRHWFDDCPYHPDRVNVCPTCGNVCAHWADGVCPYDSDNPDGVREEDIGF